MFFPQSYTSLGSTYNTFPNPALKVNSTTALFESPKSSVVMSHSTQENSRPLLISPLS